MKKINIPENSIKYLVSALSILLAAAVAVTAFILTRNEEPPTGPDRTSDNIPAASGDGTTADETTVKNDTTPETEIETELPWGGVESGVLTVSADCGDDGERVIFSTLSLSESATALGADTNALIIRNGLPGSVGVTLLIETDGGELLRQELTFEDGGTRLPLDGGSRSFSLILTEDGKETFYAASGPAFTEALESSAATVSMIGNIDLPEAVISSPLVWETNGFSFTSEGDLRFSSDTEGEITINNVSETDIRCRSVRSDAPLWDFTIAVPFGSFTESKPFYIYAKSVNGKAIDCSLLYIDSPEDWAAVTEGGRLNLRSSVEHVICEGSFTLTGTGIDRGVSFTFSGKIGIEGKLSFDSLYEGTIKIDNSKNSVSLGSQIRFETPHADIEYLGDDAPKLSYVEQYMNVLCYNGKFTDPMTGGDGTALIKSGTISDAGSGFTAGVTPDGYVIDISVGYNDRLNLEGASLDIALTAEGKSKIIKKDGAYYCVVTDKAGKTRGYKLNLYKKEYKLPVIHITTDGGAEVTTKDYYIGGTFSIDYNGAYSYTGIEGARMEIKGRGNSSWKLDKKPYKIKFEKGTSLFGLTKAKRWVLVANHADHSLIRNKLAYSIGTVLDNLIYIPNAYMVDVFVNGEYQGVYQLSEHLEVNDGRVPGEEDSTEIDTDYFLEIGGDTKKTSFGKDIFTHKLFRFVEIKNPNCDVLSKEQFDYISAYVKSVEDAIMNGGDYESLLDVPSLVDWFLLYEFSYNLDGIFRRSDFLLKVKGGKLYFCTPWDFDYAFGNMGLDSADYHEWISLGNSKTDAYDEYIKTNIMDYLLKDPNFTSQVKKRWGEVGEKMLSIGLRTVDDTEKIITPSAKENFKRWDIMGTKVQFEKRDTYKIKTYSGQLDYLRDFMRSRYSWMDKTIKAM